MSDPRYQRHTGAYHVGLSAACLLAVGSLAWWEALNVGSAVGLLLTSVTNMLIGWEKYDLLRRGKA